MASRLPAAHQLLAGEAGMSKLESDELKTQAAILLNGSVHAAQKAAEEAQRQAAEMPAPEDEQARVDRMVREAAAKSAQTRKPQADPEASPDTSLNHEAPASDTQAGYKCAWTLRGGGDKPEIPRDSFQRLAQDAMAELGQPFADASEATDTWLERVFDHRRARNTRRTWDDWRLKRICEASAEYCADLAVASKNGGNLDEASRFTDLAQQFRQSPDPQDDLRALRRRRAVRWMPPDTNIAPLRPPLVEPAPPPLRTATVPDAAALRTPIRPPMLAAPGPTVKERIQLPPESNLSIGEGQVLAEVAEAPVVSRKAVAPTTRIRKPPTRKPDVEISVRRRKLFDRLSTELATIKMRVKRYCDAAMLKLEYPDFELWNHIGPSDVEDLLKGNFSPRAFAANLTLVAFGNTSRQTLKKDRRKLEKAGIGPPTPRLPIHTR
jgi:hypothetical protein